MRHLVTTVRARPEGGRANGILQWENPVVGLRGERSSDPPVGGVHSPCGLVRALSPAAAKALDLSVRGAE